jgi:hypothetical protein
MPGSLHGKTLPHVTQVQFPFSSASSIRTRRWNALATSLMRFCGDIAARRFAIRSTLLRRFSAAESFTALLLNKHQPRDDRNSSHHYKTAEKHITMNAFLLFAPPSLI